MSEKETHEHFMRAAIREALQAEVERTRPNPRVGSVIVENGAIVGRGFFEEDGTAHAERRALQSLGRRPNPGAVLYVTLEPCSTQGRTGACTDAILESGIETVVTGALDPTPEHRGHGLDVLRKAGVTVVAGILEAECLSINPGFGGRSTSSEEA